MNPVLFLLIVYYTVAVVAITNGFLKLKKKVKPVTKLKWSISMKNAVVTLGWSKSVSTDVVDQVVVISANGVEVKSVHLPPDVESVEAGQFVEGTVLTANVTVVDGVGNTGSADAPSFTVPDLEAPAAVTNIGWTMTVVDTTDPVNPENPIPGPLH